MTIIPIDRAAPSGPIAYRRRLAQRRRPDPNNGELQLARFLGSNWLYEPWQYPLPSCHPFTPDFWLPASGSQPELHVELTWLDWAIARAESRLVMASGDSRTACLRRRKLATELRELQLRWDRKQLKVSETNRLYGPVHGLEVILLTRELAEGLIGGAACLEDLRPSALVRVGSRRLGSG